MTEDEFTQALEDVLDDLDPDCDVLYDQVKRVISYKNAGMHTHDQGLVVQTSEGAEFQVTVKRSK